MIKNVIYIFSMLYLSEFCMYGNSFLPPNIYSKGKLGEGGGELRFVLWVLALLEIFEDRITLINRWTTVTLHLYSVLKIL